VDAGFGTTLANWGTHPRDLGIRMTLIAAVGLDTYPVVFGDLPNSGPERPDSAPDISLAGTVRSAFPAGSDWSILGLNQTVVLLGDNCVIAWAGNVVFARTVITGLRALASQAPLSPPIIEKYLAKLDPTMKDQVSLVGWLRDSEVFHQFWYRADIAESALFRRVSAGGGAATEFVMLASQISGGSWNAPGRALAGVERRYLRCYRPLRFCFGPSGRAKTTCCNTSAATKLRHLSATNLQR
jgi:hypothetical protein